MNGAPLTASCISKVVRAAEGPSAVLLRSKEKPQRQHRAAYRHGERRRFLPANVRCAFLTARARELDKTALIRASWEDGADGLSCAAPDGPKKMFDVREGMFTA